MAGHDPAMSLPFSLGLSCVWGMAGAGSWPQRLDCPCMLLHSSTMGASVHFCASGAGCPLLLLALGSLRVQLSSISLRPCSRSHSDRCSRHWLAACSSQCAACRRHSPGVSLLAPSYTAGAFVKTALCSTAHVLLVVRVELSATLACPLKHYNYIWQLAGLQMDWVTGTLHALQLTAVDKRAL